MAGDGRLERLRLSPPRLVRKYARGGIGAAQAPDEEVLVEVSPRQQLQITRDAVQSKANLVKAKDQGWRDLNEQPDQVTLLGARLEGNALTDLLGDSGVYSGKASFADGQVTSLSLDSQRDSKLEKKTYRFSQFDDGSKLYVAPGEDSGRHDLVLERPNGTIFVEHASQGSVDEGIGSLLQAGGLPDQTSESGSPGVEGTPWLSLLGDIAKQASQWNPS